MNLQSYRKASFLMGLFHAEEKMLNKSMSQIVKSY